MSQKHIQVSDVGLYLPEQLVMRGGQTIVAIYRNLNYSISCEHCYTIVYLNPGGLHTSVTTYSNGKVYNDGECNIDVLLKYELPVANNKENPTKMDTKQEFDIGDYQPEELILQNGSPVIAVYKNTDKAVYPYSVVHYNGVSHINVYTQKDGQEGTNTESGYNVILKKDKDKELLSKAWNLFRKTRGKDFDPYPGLQLHIYRDGSGNLSKGGDEERLFSFSNLSDLIEKLERKFQ